MLFSVTLTCLTLMWLQINVKVPTCNLLSIIYVRFDFTFTRFYNLSENGSKYTLITAILFIMFFRVANLYNGFTSFIFFS